MCCCQRQRRAGPCCAVNAVADSANLYFTDDGYPQLIFQESLAGGTPTELYSYARVPASNPPYLLVGSNGSLLVMSTYEEMPGGTSPATYTVTSYPSENCPPTPQRSARPFTDIALPS